MKGTKGYKTEYNFINENLKFYDRYLKMIKLEITLNPNYPIFYLAYCPPFNFGKRRN